MLWHYDARKVRQEDIQVLAQKLSREQLAQEFIGQDLALRGALKTMFLILHYWLGLTLLNVVFALGYYLCPKQKALALFQK